MILTLNLTALNFNGILTIEFFFRFNQPVSEGWMKRV